MELLAGNVLIVSKSGDDAKGARQRYGSHFLTPPAAEAAAAAGDTIVVYPGTYALTAPLGAKSVNYLCLPGVTLANAGGLVVSAAGAVALGVYGRGYTLTSASVGGGGVVDVSHAGAAVTVEGAAVAGADNSVPAARVAAGSLTLRDCRLSADSDGGGVVHGGGAQRLERCRVTNLAAGAPAVAVTAGGLILDHDILVSDGACLDAATPQSVTNMGSYATTAKNPNITELVEPVVISAAVR